MASSSHTTPETLISLKVNHDGLTKKVKLQLRDLGASTLEDKLRTVLNIPSRAPCEFERYSDSAASYVVLDPTNVSVYKQLYRAAKAKQKLKLRITTKPEVGDSPEEEQKPVPKPVTVEDVPEGSEVPEVKEAKPAAKLSSPAPIPRPSQLPLHAQLNSMARNHEELEKNIAKLEASVAGLAKKASTKSFTPRAAPSPTPRTVPIMAGMCSQRFSEPPRPQSEVSVSIPRATFAVCCNSCERTIPEAHYHCSTCDEGDFDLCQDCVDMGITCYGTDHWLIKRFIKNGVITNSTTERIAPRPKKKAEPTPVPVAPITQTELQRALLADDETRHSFKPFESSYQHFEPAFDLTHSVKGAVRTCNNCVGELPESEFLHCTTCLDFDLCKSCFAKNDHGHHPKHGFIAAVAGTPFDREITSKLAPGRNQRHNAICDGCDKYINGVRHKCLDCPDWDYCADCVVNAGFVHPNHRFVPIYEPLGNNRQTPQKFSQRPVHFGICCDGPLCTSSSLGSGGYIVGDRYKCAVCHDKDFCANCEASPANTHNDTHPLIKFKTPVRHVSVTTTGQHRDGKRMPIMGDRIRQSTVSSQSRSTETMDQGIAINDVQTVVDVKPTELIAPIKAEEKEVKVEEPEKPSAPAVAQKDSSTADLVAVYESDSIADGTVLPPNQTFEQTWVLRNTGTAHWPANCSIKFVGGDYMGHVDPNHPAGIPQLVSASESTKCYKPVLPGECFEFSIILRTPSRSGKAVSYWRLSTEDGVKFGHRLWCDIEVQAQKEKKVEKVEEEASVAPSVKSSEESVSSTIQTSQMIFPKLEKESPEASVHEDIKSTASFTRTKVDEEIDDFESVDEAWAEESDDGFLTDEEYDILDASDEEYLEEQQQKLLKK